MLILSILGVVASMIIIWKASDYFEAASGYLGRNLSDGVKGASIDAIASSMPELLTGFIFLFFLQGSDGYAGTIGTTAGSAVFNSLIIPGLVILAVLLFFKSAKSISVSQPVVRRDGFFLLAAEVLLILTISGNRITWWEGGLLVLFYIVYVVFMFRGMRKSQSEGTTHRHDPGTPQETKESWITLTISITFITAACWLLVYCVDQASSALGVNLIFGSIILASAASSVPDTIISIRSAKAGEYDDAVSNALGSNIFDICIAHGLPLMLYGLFIGPVIMETDTTAYSLELRVWLLILTAITVLIYLFNKKMKAGVGFFMIFGLYGLFLLFVLGRAAGAEWAIQLGNMLNIFS